MWFQVMKLFLWREHFTVKATKSHSTVWTNPSSKLRSNFLPIPCREVYPSSIEICSNDKNLGGSERMKVWKLRENSCSMFIILRSVSYDPVHLHQNFVEKFRKIACNPFSHCVSYSGCNFNVFQCSAKRIWKSATRPLN